MEAARGNEVKKTFLILLLILFPALASAQVTPFSDIVLTSRGTPAGGALVSVCGNPGLATTAASVTSNIAILTMTSNPITAGFFANMTLIVSGFTGGDTYFNGTFTTLTVTSTTVTYALTHANASAGTNGSAFQTGNSSTACAPLSTIYSDSAGLVPITQPGFAADGLGNYQFYAIPGTYNIQFYGPVLVVRVKPVVLPFSTSANTTLTGNLTLTGFTTLSQGSAFFSSGSPWIDVKSSPYGAKCDSTTDDSTAINAASTAGSSGSIGVPSLVYFPTGNCNVKSQIVEKQSVVFKGEDNGSSIVADSTFPVSTPLIQVGNVALNNLTRVEHLVADCNNVTGSIGLSTTTAQEMSGMDYVTVRRCMNFGVDVENNAQNTMWTNSQVVNSASAPGTAEGFRINTNASVKTTLFNISVVPGGGAGQTACIHDVLGVLLAYSIHCENNTDGVRFDSGAFGAVHGYTGASNVTNAVKLNAGVGGIFLSEIEKNGGTNAVNDTDCGTTLTDNVVPFYAHSHSGSKCAWLDSAGFNATSLKVAGVVNSTGLQLFNTTTTCTTGASVGATCTTAAITLPVAEADTSYRMVCTGKGLTNVPVVIATTNSSATQFTITIAALTAAAASFSSYDCTAGHN